MQLDLEDICKAFTPEVGIAIGVVVKAGALAQEISRQRNIDFVSYKEVYGKKRPVTKADVGVEEFIVSSLAPQIPGLLFIVEEGVVEAVRKWVIARENLTEKPKAPRAILDAIDGSEVLLAGGAEWAIALEMELADGCRAGIHFAPDIRYGVLYIAEISGMHKRFTWLERQSNGKFETGLFPSRNQVVRQLPLVRHGFRMKEDSRFEQFLAKLSEHAVISLPGCCSLGLSMVAAGMIDCYLQEFVEIYDFAGGKVMVEANGKVFKAFRFQNCELIELPSDLDVEAYTNKTTWFLAGESSAVNMVLGLLEETCEHLSF